jgi:hypothetical protein
VRGRRLDWSKIQSPKPEQVCCPFSGLHDRKAIYNAPEINMHPLMNHIMIKIIPFADLKTCPKMEETALLGKLAVLKLNGGLGTTMGIFE